jgi:hypothetical protein
MPSLAETQRRLRNAVVTGEATGISDLLVGGRDAQRRLAIHRRHYETSLVTALLGKFPATAWLVGATFLTDAAQAFVRECPPQAPCIAEYGARFPDFLSTRPGAERLPYLRDFAELEWAIGQVSIAIGQPALSRDALSGVDETALPDIVFALQPGVRYLHATWPVDDLMTLYLTELAPDQLSLESSDTWIQVRGARGAFDISRLDPGDFVFRRAISEGLPIGDAAGRALDTTTGFDPGRALAALIAEGLITAIAESRQGDHP